MDIENQVDFYDKHWQHKKLNSLKLLRAIEILKLFFVAKKKFKQPKLLDLGCGDGRLTAFLGEFGFSEGVELSKVAVEHANNLYKHSKFYQGDILNMELKQDYYDVVVSQEVLEHFYEQESYLSVCKRVLKSGGYLILTTPNKYVFEHMKSGKSWSNQPIENPVYAKELKRMLSKDFEIERFYSFIYNFGDQGHFKLVNSRYIIGLCNRIGLKRLREHFLGKLGYGLHFAVLARKK